MALSAKEWEELYKKAEAKAQEKEDVYRALAKKQIANQFKNNNVLEGVAYGAKTGINQVQSGFESAGLGLQHTVADVLGMDEKANELAIALKKSAQEQAKRQAKINSQYDTNFGGIAKAASDVTAGAVGMLPTIGAAVITPQGKAAAAGKLAQVGAKALRALPSAGVMGAQATGAGINQALNEGANINQAKAYGLGSAVKEVATELPFAGIARVPGLVNVGQKLAGNKMASGVINAATEGAEEAVAEAIDPQLQRWTYNPNADNASLDDMLYSALIGAGTAGLINSGFAGAGKAANMALGTAKNKKMLPTAPKNAQNQGISPQNVQNGAGQAQTSQTTKYLPRPDKTAQNQIIEVEKIRKQMEKEQAELLKQKNALWAQKEQMEQAERDNLYREIKNLEETINLLRGTQSSAFDDALFNAMDEYTAPQQKEKLSFDMPMSERTLDNVSNPKVKAYQSTHPEVKAFFREQAEIMLNDLNNMIDGGREYGIDPETRNVNVVRSQTRATSSQIERLLNAGMTKAQIRDGLERIIRDNGAENTANAKKVETTLDDALANGYQSMQGPIPKNLDYVYNNADIKKMQNAYGKLNSEESFANAAVPAGLINELQYLDDRITERQQLIDAYSELLPDMSVYETMTAEELHNEMAKLENASQYAPNEIAGEMMARHRYLELLEEGRVNEFIENENMKTHVANLEKQLADKKLSFELPRASDDIKKIQKKLDEIEAKQAGISVFNKAQNENPNDIRPKLKRPVQPEPTVAENTTVTEQSPKVGSERDYEDFDVNQLPKDVLDFYDNVGQVGKKAGFNVRVVTGIENDANGMFDGRGNILIDGNKMTDEKTISRVIGHEGFHFLKDTGEHKYIIDLAVNDGMQKEGLTKDQLIQKKIEDYYKRSKGKVVLDRDGALDEIGAEFMEKILTDPKLAERVWNQNPTLAQRIMWWLEDMVQKITGKADENPNAEIYRKALNAYSRGLRNMQYQNRSQGEIRYMFAGEKSRTADREALARAQQMEADGADMESIRQQTGWFKSKVTGNKWAYEIDDSTAYDGKKYLYDLIKVKEDGSTLASTQKGSAIRADESALAGSNHLQSDNIIPENQRKVNDDTRYSLDELVDEYGSIPKGEDPYGDNRDIDIPKQTADDNRVSRFARTAAESRNVHDRTVDMVVSDMEQGRFTYEPSGNQEQINRANGLINHTGWERQLERFQNKYRNGERMTADDIVLGERLIQEAQNAGDYETAVDLIADIAAIGTELGQAVQALSVLKRLTPESKVKALKRVEERINADLIERKVKPVDEVKGKPIGEIQSGNVKPDHYKDVKLEIASQQNFDNEFLQVKIPDELLTQMLQAESQQMQSEIWDMCIEDMANQVPATLADKINAWRYLAMLSNPKTHIRNMVGNSVMRSVSAVKRGIQTSLENRLLTAGEERYTELNRNVPKEYFDFAEASWQNEGKKRAEASGGRYNDAVGQVERKKRIFKIELLEKWRKGNENALFGEDMMFKKSAYINALARYMHTNGLAPSELQSVASNASYEKGVAFALKEADKATFQEASKVANLLSRMEHSSPVAKLLMGGALPFKKTPINILKRGVEYSPVGLMNGLYKMRYDVQNGKMTKAEAIDAISAGLTGTGIMVLGYFMASMGWITAGAGEDDERKQWYDQSMGSQNYALVLPNGGTATIDWLAPSVMPLMAGAELYSQLTSENPANENSSAVTSTLEAISKVANPVLEMSMLQGVTGALQSYNSGTTGVLSDLITSTATSYGGQFIPAPVGAMARTVDDTVRSSYAPKDSAITKTGEKFIRQQVNKLPFASMTNEASIDVWGNEVKRAGGNIVGRAFNNFLNPATYSSDKRTELDKKLNELYEATGNSGVLPKSGTTYINESDSNPKVYLSAKEYAKYGTTRGQNSYQYVNSFVNSSAYSQLADEDKAEIISNLYDLANYQAKKEALNGRGYNYVQEQYEKVLKSKMEPQKYYIAKYNMDLIADNVTTGQKKEQISYLKGLQQDGVITDEQCWYLRRAMIGKFSKSEMAACPYAWIKQL